MTPFQVKLVATLRKMPNHQGSVMELAYRLKSNAAAITSSSRALAKGGTVVVWRHGEDRWASLCVSLSRNTNEQGQL